MCLVRSPARAREIEKPGVFPVFGDLNDIDALLKAVEGVVAVFHIAGAIKASTLGQYLEANQFGTRRLLEAAAANPNLRRFVHISSLAAAGPSQGIRALKEEDQPNPISWYGESKLRSEKEVLQFSNVFPTTILRPPAVFGSGDMETLLIFRMVRRGWLFTPGGSSRPFSLIHIKDLAEACIKAAEIDTRSGEIFYISRPEVYEWKDFGDAIARALGKRYVRIPFPQFIAIAAGKAGDVWSRCAGRPSTVSSQKIREILQPGWLCDSSKAYQELGFAPAVDLENGIREACEWYQSHGFL